MNTPPSDHDTEKRPAVVPGDAHIQTGDVYEDYGADSDLQRRLSSRHISMIALGSSIGMGLWLGSGTSLTEGGPAAIFIGC